MPPHQLFEDRHRTQTRRTLEHRHHLLVEDPGQRVRSAASAPCRLLGRQPPILLEAISRRRAKARSGCGGGGAIGSSKFHVKPHLVIGYVSPRHKVFLLWSEETTLAGWPRSPGGAALGGPAASELLTAQRLRLSHLDCRWLLTLFVAPQALPRYVEDEFEAYLKCGLLEHGFLRVKCDSCQAEKLVAYSCKRRGFCPSCGARRMVETAALLIDEVLPRQPIRQWVLSLPIALRYLLATRPEVVTQVLGIVYRAISGHLIRKAGLTRASAVTGAVTLIQRFGSALNLNVHLHMLVLDGVYRREGEGRLRFVPVPAPTSAELNRLVQRVAERIGRSLERSGLITRDMENAYLAFYPGEEAPKIGRASCRE